MRKDILALLERDGKLTAEDIAIRLGLAPADVANEIAKMEDEQIICGYGAFVDWKRAGGEHLTALIEVKVTPSRGKGFNRIAERIYRFEEVKAVYLMSGAYDLAVIIDGKSLNDIAGFVSDKLSTLESVLSTATHFVLNKYKDHGVIFDKQSDEDGRQIVSP